MSYLTVVLMPVERDSTAWPAIGKATVNIRLGNLPPCFRGTILPFTHRMVLASVSVGIDLDVRNRRVRASIRGACVGGSARTTRAVQKPETGKSKR